MYFDNDFINIFLNNLRDKLSLHLNLNEVEDLCQLY